MRSKFWTIFNWGFLVVVTLVAVWVVFGFPQNVKVDNENFSIPPKGCVDVNSIDKFEYQACYDASSKMIFLKADRGVANYPVDRLLISFVDLSSQFFNLKDIPTIGLEKAYKIPAKKNPGSMNIRLGVAENFSSSTCGGKNVFVDYCPAGTSGKGVGVSISPIEGVGLNDFIEIKDLPKLDSDIVSMSLVEKESIWKSTCDSSWNCGEWGICDNGVQRRDCMDSSGCAVSTDFPVSVRRCDGSCVENWQCKWSGCENGVSSPICNDLNNCGTSFNIPKKLSCVEEGKCSPDVVCSSWTECETNYNFNDLVGADKLTKIGGVKTRVCTDLKGCIDTEKESKSCSVSVDIYTKKFEKCGDSYVGVYNVLDNSTLAILKRGSMDNNYLNIYFGTQDGIYCDYCFDGKLDGDEDDVDCGGSCKICVSKSVEQKSWWRFLFDNFVG